MNELKFNRGRESLFCSKQSHSFHLKYFVPILYPHFHHLSTVQLMKTDHKYLLPTSLLMCCDLMLDLMLPVTCISGLNLRALSDFVYPSVALANSIEAL